MRYLVEVKPVFSSLRNVTSCNQQFDEILKYCNELSNTIDLDSTLAQAEVLFLSFAQLLADVDRRQAEDESGRQTSGLRQRTKLEEANDLLLPKKVVISEELRALLT